MLAAIMGNIVGLEHEHTHIQDRDFSLITRASRFAVLLFVEYDALKGHPGLWS